MARKDVELLVRANDQASKLLENITDAINGMAKAEEGADKATTGLGSTFDKVGRTLTEFAKAWQSATPGDRIAKDIERASKTTAKYAGDIEGLSQDLVKQRTELDRNKASVKELATEIEKLTKKQAAEKAALQQARAARTQTNRELNQTGTAIKKLTTEQTNLTAKIAEQAQKTDQSAERYARLKAEVESTVGPTKRLVESTEAAGRALAKNAARLEKYRADLNAATEGIEKAKASQKEYTGALAQADKAVAAQKEALANANGQLSAREKALTSAARAEGKLTTAISRTEQEIEDSTASLEQSKQALAELENRAKEAGQSMDKLAQTMRSGLIDALRLQQSNLDRISKAYRETSAAQAALSRTMSAAGVPTREMVEQQKKLAAASKEIANLHFREKAALAAMRQELSATAADSSRLVATQTQFASAIKNSTAALGQAQAAASRNAEGTNRIASSAQRAAQATQRLGTAQQREAGSANQAAAANNKLAQAYRKVYGESRQAMSWTQRLRGEVLSLAATYGGLYGAIEVLSRAVDATRTLEQAQVRLKSVFGTDLKAGQELDFLRRTADSLALDFGLLTQEYSKFAAATKNTNLEGEKTRKVFLAVGKAARVQALSTEEVEGVFKAITQIASKGRVQLEELSGQLGDRLPGALQIMADGLGVTTAELLDMTKAGEVTSAELEGFAEELERRYGKFVPEAMTKTGAALQDLGNAAFQALLKFGDGGFMAGFRDMLNSITETLRSADFADFASRLSAALGILAKFLGLVIDNFDLLIIAGSTFAGLKLAPLVTVLFTKFWQLATGAKTAAAAVATASVNMRTAQGASAGLALGIGRIGTALKALTASTVIGAIVTAVATGIGFWATRATEATTALNEHRKVVDEVKNAYEAAGGKVDEWASKVVKVTEAQAKQTMELAQSVAAQTRQSLRVEGVGRNFRRESEEVQALAAQIRDVQDEFVRTGGDVDAFKRRIEELGDSVDNDKIAGYVLDILNAADGMRETEDRARETEASFRVLNGTATEADAILLGLADATDEASKNFYDAETAVGNFQEALAELKGFIPGLAKELKKLKELESIDDAYNAAVNSARTMGQVYEAGNLRQQAIDNVNFGDAAKALEGFTDGVEAASALIRKKESFSATAYADYTYRDGKRVNSGYRVGYGSGTMTGDDGSVRQVTSSSTTTRQAAEQDLYRRITQEFMPKIVKSIGVDKFAQLSAQQQAVLTSITYNYGQLPDQLANAIRTGNTEDVVQAIRDLGSHNKGINRERRNEEAFIYGGGGDPAAMDEKSAEAAAKKAERAREFHETQRASLESMQQEIALQNEGLIARETEKALLDARNAAKAAGTTLTKEEEASIRETIALKYQEQAAQEALNATKQTAQEAEQRVNDLLTQRRELEAQIAIYKKEGNTAAVATAEVELAGVNNQLQQAITNAIAMWEAVGGSGADAAIASLRTAALEAKNLGDAGQKAKFDWQQVGQLFANGLVRAFDSFAQKVAEGKDIGEAAAEAFMEFAAQFLIDIGKMIVQQIVFNAVSGIMKGFGLGGLGGGIAGVLHSGGIAGSGGRSRSVPATAFIGAPRFHNGGIPGLKPNEVPLIAEREEEILTRDDPRHMFNLGKGGGGQAAAPKVDMKIINSFDPVELLSKSLSTEPGQRVFINNVRALKDEINGALS